LLLLVELEDLVVDGRTMLEWILEK